MNTIVYKPIPLGGKSCRNADNTQPPTGHVGRGGEPIQIVCASELSVSLGIGKARTQRGTATSRPISSTISSQAVALPAFRRVCDSAIRVPLQYGGHDVDMGHLNYISPGHDWRAQKAKKASVGRGWFNPLALALYSPWFWIAPFPFRWGPYLCAIFLLALFGLLAPLLWIPGQAGNVDVVVYHNGTSAFVSSMAFAVFSRAFSNQSNMTYPMLSSATPGPTPGPPSLPPEPIAAARQLKQPKPSNSVPISSRQMNRTRRSPPPIAPLLGSSVSVLRPAGIRRAIEDLIDGAPRQIEWAEQSVAQLSERGEECTEPRCLWIWGEFLPTEAHGKREVLLWAMPLSTHVGDVPSTCAPLSESLQMRLLCEDREEMSGAGRHVCTWLYRATCSSYVAGFSLAQRVSKADGSTWAFRYAWSRRHRDRLRHWDESWSSDRASLK